MPIQTGDNKFGVAQWIVDPIAGLGTHTTIASAITSASAGDTIFIKPGTYTENLTLKVGVDLAAFEADCQTPNVTIIGNCTLTTAGTVSISGIRLQTNGAACITVSGSAASILKLSNCFINAADATAIVFSSSSASALLYFHECTADLATTGIAYFTGTSAGTVRIIGGYWQNTGLSSTASTFSAGSFFPFMVAFDHGFTISGTAVMSGQFCSFNAGVANATAITISAGSSSLNNSTFNGGTASAISVGAGATLNLDTADVSSSNANAITGLGTLRFGLITYTGSSSTNNVSTQTPFVTQPSFGSSSGQIVQQVRTRNNTKTQYTAIAAIPRDTSIPQITEGVEVLTLAITPTNASNILFLELNLTGAVDSTTNNNLEICLFQDATANALETQTFDLRAVSQEGCVYFYFSYFMVAGTTSATTFRIRLGGQNLANLTVNGVNNVALYGGTMGTIFTITEITP
jgi:hypothetical protein